MITETTIEIKNYELSLTLAKKSATNTIKIFAKRNNKKITHVFLRFKKGDNDNKRVVKQLHEDTTTKLRYVRLFLGENERLKILDFLRNEKNGNFTFNFDSDNFITFGFGDLDDDGVFKTVNSFKINFFKLHSKVPKSAILDTSTPVTEPLVNK